MAHSPRFGGTWLPTRHEDVAAIAHDTEHFSSNGVIVSVFEPEDTAPVGYAPPITSDPPFHEVARRLLLPGVLAQGDPTARGAPPGRSARELIDDVLGRRADPTGSSTPRPDYAQHIPVRVIAHMLGVPPEDGDRFRGFIHRILETGGQNEPVDPGDTLIAYLLQTIEDHRAQPGDDDLIDFLVDAELEGEPLDERHIVGTIALLLLAGIDTTWSAIGASIWHLAQHPEHRRHLVEHPEADADGRRGAAAGLRAGDDGPQGREGGRDRRSHAARRATGCCCRSRRRTVTPSSSSDADEVILDRAKNRHAAFGLGIHRCLGSNLARWS